MFCGKGKNLVARRARSSPLERADTKSRTWPKAKPQILHLLPPREKNDAAPQHVFKEPGPRLLSRPGVASRGIRGRSDKAPEAASFGIVYVTPSGAPFGGFCPSTSVSLQ